MVQNLRRNSPAMGRTHILATIAFSQNNRTLTLTLTQQAAIVAPQLARSLAHPGTIAASDPTGIRPSLRRRAWSGPSVWQHWRAGITVTPASEQGLLHCAAKLARLEAVGAALLPVATRSSSKSTAAASGPAGEVRLGLLGAAHKATDPSPRHPAQQASCLLSPLS